MAFQIPPSVLNPTNKAVDFRGICSTFSKAFDGSNVTFSHKL